MGFGAGTWTQGVEETLAYLLSQGTLAELSASGPLAPDMAALVLNDYAGAAASLDALNSPEPTAQWQATQVYDSGTVRVYRVTRVIVYAIGGETNPETEGTCGAVTEGAVVTNVYGAASGNSTAGANPWTVLTLPQQADASSGPVDPCGAVGATTNYDVPTIYVATLRPTVPSGIPWTPLPEAVVGWASLVPADDNVGAASALVASGLPPCYTQPTSAMYTLGLMPGRPRPIGAI